ncbi:MAG: RNA polymerase sigma factor [Acidobacteriota bacterium]
MEDKFDRIVDLAKAGNNNAMRTLYDMNREKIMNLALKYTGNREDAEEILHDTFITAFSALQRNKLKDPNKFHSWLYRIGMNTSIDFLRREKKHRHTDIGENNLPDNSKSGEDPENELIDNEKETKISKAISALSPRQRMIFTLKHHQQMKIREIAATLKCSEGNVKTQLFRAVRSLRNELKPSLMEE